MNRFGTLFPSAGAGLVSEFRREVASRNDWNNGGGLFLVRVAVTGLLVRRRMESAGDLRGVEVVSGSVCLGSQRI